MGRRAHRKSIERYQYRQYHTVAQHFYEAARDSIALEYWTAAGVLIVHSAIAYSDALCIQQSGQRSIGDDHEDAVELLNTVIAIGKEKTNAMNHLRRIIEEKTRVSYLGELYEPKRTKDLWKRLERFRHWAESILNK